MKLIFFIEKHFYEHTLSFCRIVFTPLTPYLTYFWLYVRHQRHLPVWTKNFSFSVKKLKKFCFISVTLVWYLKLLITVDNLFKFASGLHNSFSYRLGFSTIVEKYLLKVWGILSFSTLSLSFSFFFSRMKIF